MNWQNAMGIKRLNELWDKYVYMSEDFSDPFDRQLELLLFDINMELMELDKALSNNSGSLLRHATTCVWRARTALDAMDGFLTDVKDPSVKRRLDRLKLEAEKAINCGIEALGMLEEEVK